jgi:hypothetical protein
MSGPLLAEFRDPDALLAALQKARQSGHKVLDTFTPFPVKGVAESLEIPPSRIRVAMLVGGLAMAAFAYWLQWWSAVFAYPVNSGGRPLHSWPVFLLVPFEVGVLASAAAGLVALLWRCGLPRLNHPLFDVGGFERASQDRFFLLVQESPDAREPDLYDLLHRAGALMITEIRP